MDFKNSKIIKNWNVNWSIKSFLGSGQVRNRHSTLWSCIGTSFNFGQNCLQFSFSVTTNFTLKRNQNRVQQKKRPNLNQLRCYLRKYNSIRDRNRHYWDFLNLDLNPTCKPNLQSWYIDNLKICSKKIWSSLLRNLKIFLLSSSWEYLPHSEATNASKSEKSESANFFNLLLSLGATSGL